MKLQNIFVGLVLVVGLASALWYFVKTREEIYADLDHCDFDNPEERLKELEAAFASGLLTHEEFDRLAEKLVGTRDRKTSGISSRTLPKTWDEVEPKKRGV